MNTIISKILSSAGLQKSLSVATSNIAASLIAAITILIISRNLGPNQFGVFAGLSAFYLLLNRISDIGLNLALQRYIVTTPQPKWLSAIRPIFWTKGAIWISIMCISIAFSSSLQNWLHASPQTIIILLFGIPGLMSYELINVILQAKQQFTQNNLLNLLQASFKLIIVLIIIKYSQLTSLTALYIYLFTPTLISLTYLHKIKKNYLQQDFRIPLPIRSAIKWTSIAAISAALADNLDVILIQKFLDTTQTGLFAAASRLAIFASIIGMSLGTVLSIRVAQYDQENLRKYLKKSIILSLGIISITLICAPFAPNVIKILLSEKYIGSSNVLTILLIATGIDIASSPLIALFYKFNKPQFYAYSGGITIALIICSNVLLIPIAGIQGAAYAKLITRSFHAIFVIGYTYYAYLDHQKTNHKY